MSEEIEEWRFPASGIEKLRAVVFFLLAGLLVSRFHELFHEAIAEDRWFMLVGIAFLFLLPCFAICSGVRLLEGERVVRRCGNKLFFLDTTSGFGKGRWKQVDQVSDDQIQFHLHSRATGFSISKKLLSPVLSALIRARVDEEVDGTSS